jgi:hypothetical protein
MSNSTSQLAPNASDNGRVVDSEIVRADDSASLIETINSAHAACCRSVGDALYHAMAAGDALNALKSSVPHGGWKDCLYENCREISPRTARRYMRLAKHRDAIEAKRSGVAILSLTDASRLISGESDPLAGFPADVRAKIEKSIEDLRETLREGSESGLNMGRALADARTIFGADTKAFKKWAMERHSDYEMYLRVWGRFSRLADDPPGLIHWEAMVALSKPNVPEELAEEAVQIVLDGDDFGELDAIKMLRQSRSFGD